MSLTIRPARREDCGLVLEMIRELAEYEKLAHEAVASEDDIAAALCGPAPRVFCEIAAWEGAPAGFALWFHTFSSFVGRHGIWLEDLFVRPAFRGHGIGGALIAGLARRCAAEGLGRLEWSVLDWNAPSIAFYEALGAVPMREWTTYRLSSEALARAAER